MYVSFFITDQPTIFLLNGMECDLYIVILFSLLCIGCGQNPARQAAMSAGVPKEVPATSLNMLCGSGLRAVSLGYQAIKCGESSVVVAGGQESMSQVRQ